MSPAYVVKTMIRALGNSLRMAMIASMPLISGICRSMRVMSGWCRRNCSIASRPVAACATNFMSGSISINDAMPWRRSAWSSAARIRIVLVSAFMAPQLSPEEGKAPAIGGAVSHRARHGQHRFGARPRFAPEVEFASKSIGAFPHSREPIMSGTPAGFEDFGIDSFSVVANVQEELAALVADLDLDPFGLGVVEGVAEQFPRDPVEFV